MANRITEIPQDLRPFFDDPFYLPSYAEMCEKFGGRDGMWSELISHSRAQKQFFCEYYTKDYIEALGEHLQPRLTADRQTTILEVGAGVGRLSKALGDILVDQSVAIIPIDSRPFPGVEEIDYREALKKYQPNIVLCAWMLDGKDWTPDFRQTPSVEEYLLIGEAAGSMGASGTDETWDREVIGADGFRVKWLHELGDL